MAAAAASLSAEDELSAIRSDIVQANTLFFPRLRRAGLLQKHQLLLSLLSGLLRRTACLLYCTSAVGRPLKDTPLDLCRIII